MNLIDKINDEQLTLIKIANLNRSGMNPIQICGMIALRCRYFRANFSVGDECEQVIVIFNIKVNIMVNMVWKMLLLKEIRVFHCMMRINYYYFQCMI